MAWFGIDISNWQRDIDLSKVMPNVDFVIVKATDGLSYVDPMCAPWAEQLMAAGKPWGFYHFARRNDAIAEADFFVDSTANYFGNGIPVLDWEDDQDHAWVNAFVRRVKERTGIWPWIYANPWRFGSGGVNPHCARWLAAYQSNLPEADQAAAAWQYTSTGRVEGYGGNLDCNWFYGGTKEWNAYSGGDDMTVDELLNAEIAVQTADGKGQTNMKAWQVWSWAYRYSQDAVSKIAALENRIAALEEKAE